MKILPLNSVSNAYTDYIQIKETGLQLTHQQYVPFPRGVGVCMRKRGTYTWRTLVKEVEIYLYYLFTSMSVIGNAATSCSILRDQANRKVSQLAMVALLLALLLSDIISIISTSLDTDEGLCYALSLCLHWSLLHCQAWLVVIAFNISSQFRRAIPNHDLSVKRFVIYAFSSLFYA